MNKIKKICFSLFVFAFVFCLNLSFSTTIANAGSPSLNTVKMTDPSTIGTFFDFTIVDTNTIPNQIDSFSLEDDSDFLLI